MRFSLLIIVFCVFAIIISSCNHDGPQPDSVPYLYIHSGQFEDNQLEKWIIVTNGNGEIVDYKKIDATSDESTLTKRNANVKDKINVYQINVNKSNSVEIKAALGVEPGQHCYLGSKVSPTGKSLDVNLYKIPDKSRVTPGSGSFSMGQVDQDAADGIIDSTKITFSAWEPISVYPLTVYTRAFPKYVNVNYSSTGISKFNYPGDFINFDHVIDVPTGMAPDIVTTSGIKGGLEIFFTDLWIPYVMSAVDANQSVKLCYNDGYDSYSTFYRIDNKAYSRDGSIPSSANSFIIPNRSIVVNNHDLFSFAATIPTEIDYRTSDYSYSEIAGGKTKLYALYLTSDVTRNDLFDLKLPDEFVSANGSIDFTKFNHTQTAYSEFENNEPYSRAVDILFSVPGSNSFGQYYYFVN